MFFCDSCGRENQWPASMSKSLGPCEICHKTRMCNDVPSKYLPLIKVEKKKSE